MSVIRFGRGGIYWIIDRLMGRFVFLIRAGWLFRKKGPIKLIIFDFDGTIADTFEAAFQIFNELADELGCRRVAPSEIPLLRTMRTMEIIRYMRVPLSRMGFIARRGCEGLSARIDHIQSFPGAAEALHKLRTSGYRLGIVTSNSDFNVRRFLKNHDLEIFDFVRGSSRILGKGIELRRILREHKLSGTEVLFVGDETRDVEAAKVAGVFVAGISWGYSARSTLEATNPDVLIDSLAELSQFLAKR